MAKRRNKLSHLRMICLAFAFILIGGCSNSGSSIRQIGEETSGPVLKWETDLGRPSHTNLSSDGGIVSVATQFEVFGLDAATGKVKWEWDPPSTPLSSPVVANGMVFIGVASLSAYALDAETGAVRWRQGLSLDPSEDVSNPIAVDGLVYFGTGWSDWSCCENRGIGGGITALDGKTGQLVWHVKTKGHYGSGGMPRTTFSVGNGLVYYGLEYGPEVDDKHLYALDAKTGKEIWKIVSDPTVPVIAPDDGLYIAIERELLCLNGKTGQERWRWALDSRKDRLSNPTVVEDTVYVVGNEKRDMCFEGPCPSRKNHIDTLYALDRNTGKEIWKQDIAGAYYPILDLTPFQQYLSYDFADIYGDTELPYLRAVDRGSGKSWWQFEIDSVSFGLPATVDNTIFLGTSSGTVYALQWP